MAQGGHATASVPGGDAADGGGANSRGSTKMLVPAVAETRPPSLSAHGVEQTPVASVTERRQAPAPVIDSASTGAVQDGIGTASVIATKGVHLVLNAIRQLPDAELWVAGSTFPVDGWPLFEEKIITLLQETPNAHYLGNIPHHSIFDLLAQSHCLVDAVRFVA